MKGKKKLRKLLTLENKQKKHLSFTKTYLCLTLNNCGMAAADCPTTEMFDCEMGEVCKELIVFEEGFPVFMVKYSLKSRRCFLREDYRKLQCFKLFQKMKFRKWVYVYLRNNEEKVLLLTCKEDLSRFLLLTGKIHSGNKERVIRERYNGVLFEYDVNFNGGLKKKKKKDWMLKVVFESSNPAVLKYQKWVNKYSYDPKNPKSMTLSSHNCVVKNNCFSTSFSSSKKRKLVCRYRNSTRTMVRKIVEHFYHVKGYRIIHMELNFKFTKKRKLCLLYLGKMVVRISKERMEQKMVKQQKLLSLKVKYSPQKCDFCGKFLPQKKLSGFGADSKMCEDCCLSECGSSMDVGVQWKQTPSQKGKVNFVSKMRLLTRPSTCSGLVEDQRKRKNTTNKELFISIHKIIGEPMERKNCVVYQSQLFDTTNENGF